MTKIIGIDLGTTNSCAAIVENGKPDIIPLAHGARTIKSAVRIMPDGHAIVGENAYAARILDPENTITGIKRYMGRHYNEVFDLAMKVPYKVIPGKNSLAMVEARDLTFSPQAISSMILRSIKEAAEQHYNEKITDAVITIPAYFNEYQRQATKEAAELSGLRVRRIVNEPTAACMAYGFNKMADCKIAVFDLGGGTFDISILELGDGVFEVKSIAGDGFLGGDDFDDHLTTWLTDELDLEYDIRFGNDLTAQQYIRDLAVRAKCELSSSNETSIIIPSNFSPNRSGQDIEIILTVERFNDICEELFERLRAPCLHALQEAGMEAAQITKAILVGGATRMTRISILVKEIFGCEPSKEVHADEAVALGAAVQASVIVGGLRDVLLLDVTKFALGVETVDGTMETLIAANTTIPAKKSEAFSTATDGQESVEIHIMQGDHRLAINNKSLGHIVVKGIEPEPAGKAKIDVTFEIDTNSIFHVTAKDRATGIEEKLTIEAMTGLTKDDFEQDAAVIKHS